MAQDGVALEVVHHEVAGIEGGDGEGEGGELEVVSGGLVAESEVVGSLRVALVVFLEGEHEVTRLHPVAQEGVAFGGGELEPDVVEALEGGLAMDVEFAQGLEGVVEELEADGVGGVGGEKV